MELNFKSYGEGEPVIILHGLFGMLDNWQSFSKKLAEDFQVIAVDQRDHGKSPHTKEFNYEILAIDLNSFLEWQNISKAHFLGHSMGGKTLLQFSKNFPDLIKKMIVVDMGIKSYPGGHEQIIEAMQTAPIVSAMSRKEIDMHLAKTIKQDSVRLFLMKNLKRDVENGGFQWKMNLDLLSESYQNILSAIEFEGSVDVDTMFVQGLKSTYIEDSDIKQIQSIFTHSKVVSIDAGHWIHAERPIELLDVCKLFFK